MAALRNLAIGALHMAERADVTEATRRAGRSMDRPASSGSRSRIATDNA